MSGEKKGKSKVFYIVTGIFATILVLMALLCRSWIFPAISGIEMHHIAVATHAVMIGVCSCIFSIIALSVKRAWKTHGKWIALPVVFTVFAFFLMAIAEEVPII